MTRAGFVLALLLALPGWPAVAGEIGFTRGGEVMCSSREAAVEQRKIKHLQQLAPGCGRTGRGWRFEVARGGTDGAVKVRLWTQPSGRAAVVVWWVR